MIGVDERRSQQKATQALDAVGLSRLRTARKPGYGWVLVPRQRRDGDRPWPCLAPDAMSWPGIQRLEGVKVASIRLVSWFQWRGGCAGGSSPAQPAAIRVPRAAGTAGGFIGRARLTVRRTRPCATSSAGSAWACPPRTSLAAISRAISPGWVVAQPEVTNSIGMSGGRCSSAIPQCLIRSRRTDGA